MPNATTDTIPNATVTPNEAARFTAEASRQSAEQARATIQATRAYLDEATALNRAFVSTWVAGTEAAVKNAFDVQNAAFAAGLSVFESATASARGTLNQWADLNRQAQQATLDAWQASVRAAEKMTVDASPNGTTRR